MGLHPVTRKLLISRPAEGRKLSWLSRLAVRSRLFANEKWVRFELAS